MQCRDKDMRWSSCWLRRGERDRVSEGEGERERGSVVVAAKRSVVAMEISGETKDKRSAERQLEEREGCAERF
jgi:hypothetical protein